MLSPSQPVVVPYVHVGWPGGLQPLMQAYDPRAVPVRTTVAGNAARLTFEAQEKLRVFVRENRLREGIPDRAHDRFRDALATPTPPEAVPQALPSP